LHWLRVQQPTAHLAEYGAAPVPGDMLTQRKPTAYAPGSPLVNSAHWAGYASPLVNLAYWADYASPLVGSADWADYVSPLASAARSAWASRGRKPAVDAALLGRRKWTVTWTRHCSLPWNASARMRAIQQAPNQKPTTSPTTTPNTRPWTPCSAPGTGAEGEVAW